MLEKGDFEKYAIISLVLVSLIAILLVFNKGPTGYAVYTKTDLGNIERGANWNKIDNGEGVYSLEIYNNIINILNGSDYIPINIQIKSSSYSNFVYELTNTPYKAYFRNNSNTAQPVRFEKDGYFFVYDISDGVIQWREQPGFPARTDTLGSGAPSNSQDSFVVINNNILTYPAAFYNTDITYALSNDMLKENFILTGLPSFKDYTYLEYTGKAYFNRSLKICANNQCYIPSGTQDNFYTSGKIEFKDENNLTIFYLKEPVITDSNGTSILGIYYVHGSDAQMGFDLRINKTFLQTAVYPIYIDPSVVIKGDSGGADAMVKGDLPNINYGSNDELWVRWGIPKRNTYLKFNISSIPENQIIDNASLCLYLFSDSGAQTIGAYHVYDSFDESTITWNNQPCGENFDNSSACNTIAESSLSNYGFQDGTWQCWNVLNMIGYEYELNNKIISIALHTGDSGDADKFYSKEYSNSSLWPYLDISYHLSDMIAPSLSIIYPSNNTNTTNNQININYSVSDANLQACWYSNDSFSRNTTLASCINITTVTWNEGQHNIVIWANDSVGNVNSSSVSFYVDSIVPVVNILLPQDGASYGYNNSISLNYSASDLNLASCWYNINNGANITLASCLNTSFNVPGDGSYAMNLYANDSLGNLGHNSVNFNVQIGSPTIVLNSPIDIYLNNGNNIEFSYTPTDVDLNYCELWGDFDGGFKLNQTDNSPVSGSENIFNLNLNDGIYLWNIKCVDNMLNFAFNGNKTFYVDTIAPILSLTEPNGAKTSRTLSASWSVSDSSPMNCKYNIYQGASLEIADTSVICSDNSVNFEVSSDASFVFNFYVNDSAGNLNSASSSFSVDTSTPVSPSPGGGGGGGGGGYIISNQTGKLKVSLIRNIIARPGDNKKIPLNIENIGKVFLNKCRLIAKGNISSWIYSNNIQGIAPGQNIDFAFDLNVPEGIKSEISFGILEIKCEEASNIQNISVSIPKEFGLIEIKDIKQEESILKINYTFDDSNFVGENIDVKIWLTDQNGSELNRIIDKVSINKEGLIERYIEMQLPEGLEGGVYFVYFAFSSDENNFIKKPVVLSITGKAVLDSEKGKFWVYIVFLVILGIAIFFIWRRHNKTDKTNKEKVRKK